MKYFSPTQHIAKALSFYTNDSSGHVVSTANGFQNLQAIPLVTLRLYLDKNRQENLVSPVTIYLYNHGVKTFAEQGLSLEDLKYLGFWSLWI